mmetsp:Transcript_88229/g.156211  ORF Transcript_88229/g.156211 Transcript_88229/m.156211 type:complete len:337 (-) Transcript_88229:52-1062(-)
MAVLQVFLKPCLIWASCALMRAGVARAYDDDEDYLDDSLACNKWYPGEVENVCHQNFPNASSEKTWVMLFSSHACPDCSQVVRGFVNWARNLRKDPSVRVGVVNCYYAKNYNSLCFPRHQIDALPTLRIIQKGKWSKDGKKKHNSQDIDALITESLYEIDCPNEAEALLANTPLVPLCEKRFPGRETITTWMVLYYTKSTADSLLQVARQVAVELGNVEKIELTPEEKKWERLKKTDRLNMIKTKYSLNLEMPRQGGPGGSGALVYMGAICCDCNSADEGFCKEMMRGYTGSMPAVGWSKNGEQSNIDFVVKSDWALMEYAITQLGYIKGSTATEL